MALPSHSSRKHGGSRLGRFLSDIVIFFASVCVFSTLMSIFGPTRHVVEQHHAIATAGRIPGPRPIIPIESLPKEREDAEVLVDYLDHEELFLATIRSCLQGNETKGQTCRNFIPDPKGDDTEKAQRVALISPPGDISFSLLHRVEEIADRHNRRKNKVDLDIDLIIRSNVPPYGYGKSHGLTKVLRLVPQPLLLEVTDALQSLLQPGETNAMITLDDVKAGLRQIIRYHCRLSHLAAHTEILSISFMDLLTQPADAMNQLRTFLVPNDTPEEDEPKEPKEDEPKEKDPNAPDEDDDDQVLTPDDDQNGLFDAQEAYGTQILTHIQEGLKIDVNEILDDVLLDELKLTKNLTAWPCLPFWASGEPAEPTKISPLLQRLAAALSPDCNDPYADCFVGRDKCEAAGDAICKKEKRM